jgi:biotin synthase-like enzyme
MIEGVDYIIEDGMLVFTREFHLKRGYCCKNGCKNCPYSIHNESKIIKQDSDDMKNS